MKPSVLRRGSAVLILGAAGLFAWQEARPWRRHQVAIPIVVSDSFTETLDTLHPGEALSDLLGRQGVRSIALARVLSALSLDPRRLRAGLVFSFQRSAADSTPHRIGVRAGPDHRLSFHRTAPGWIAQREPIRWRAEVQRLEGRINGSLYESLDEQIPPELLSGPERVRLAWDLADVYAWQIDFARDIRPGDRFALLIERRVSEEGEVRLGGVLAGELTIEGRPFSAYRFENAHGQTGFYDEGGWSLRRGFLRAPLRFRSVSSRFYGSRIHPILGTMRSHQGTDYTAAPGTPVLAAGDGTVVRAGWSGGYGNLVEIQHPSGITTRYGHLGSFARSVRAGARVSQGETIGFVGATGLATGPHLHYEFRVNGLARDSRSIDPGNGNPVPEADRDAFERQRTKLAEMLGGVSLVLLARGPN